MIENTSWGLKPTFYIVWQSLQQLWLQFCDLYICKHLQKTQFLKISIFHNETPGDHLQQINLNKNVVYNGGIFTN